MTVKYESAVPGSQFRQGEVLRGLLELQFDADEVSEESLHSKTPPATRHEHPWTILLSPDCDLEWDFRARNGEANPATKKMSHILLCDLEDLGALHGDGRIQHASGPTKLVRQNRDARFHHLESADTEYGQQLPDFLSTSSAYSVYIPNTCTP